MSPPAEVRVEYDQACVQCGYPLRQLLVTGVCPECGTAVARSFRGNRLSAADPAFVRSLYLGVSLVTGAAVWFVLAGAVLIFVGLLGAFGATRILVATAVGAIPGAVAMVAGMCAMTIRDAERLSDWRLEAARMCGRPGSIAAGAGLVGATLLEATPLRSSVWAGTAITICLLGWAATLAGGAMALGAIAARSSERSLAAGVRHVVALSGAAAAALLLRAMGGHGVFGGLAIAMGLLALGLALGILERMRASLRRDWHAARALRAPPQPPSVGVVD